MHTILMAEYARTRSEELERRAASARIARSAATSRHPRRRSRIRRRFDPTGGARVVQPRRFTREARGGASGADLSGARRA
jgi:hypothetical protein